MTAQQTTPISDAELAQIRARADAATPGLWYLRLMRDDDHDVVCMTQRDPIACDLNKQDARFIAAARTDIPRLCDELAAARRERERFVSWLELEIDERVDEFNNMLTGHTEGEVDMARVVLDYLRSSEAGHDV